MYVHEIEGRGIEIRDGDTFVIPAEYLIFSLNPLHSSATFFKTGLQWFAELIFIDSLPNKKDFIEEELKKAQEQADSALRKG